MQRSPTIVSRWLIPLASPIALAAVLVGNATAAPPAQDSPSLTAQIDIPETLEMSDHGTGQDAHFVWVTSPGGPIQMTTVGEPVILPVPVHNGVELVTYTDTGTGITVSEVEGGFRLRIPIKDSQGNDTIRIIAVVPEFVGTGDTTVGIAQSIEIDLPTASLDLSSVDANVGTASVKVLGTLSSVPGASGMTMTLQKAPAAEPAASINKAASSLGLAVDDIGFAVQFDKVNLSAAIDTITLRLQVGSAWVSNVGAGNVRIFRVADDGTTGFVDAVVADPNADPVQFNVTSPEGLSTFAIAAVSQLPPTPTPTPSPTPAPTSTPTPTLAPTATLALSATLAPTATAEPTAPPTPTPTATPIVVQQGTPSDDDGSAGGCNRSSSATARRQGLGDLALVGVVLGGLAGRRRLRITMPR